MTPIHPLCADVPRLTARSVASLRQSLAKGFDSTRPILLFDSQVIDGRHREELCAELGVTPFYTAFDGDPFDAIDRSLAGRASQDQDLALYYAAKRGESYEQLVARGYSPLVARRARTLSADPAAYRSICVDRTSHVCTYGRKPRTPAPPYAPAAPRGPSGGRGDAPYIPGGHELGGVSTLTDADGTVRERWDKTRVASAEPAELPDGFDQPSRIARQTRGDGGVVTEWRTYDRDRAAEAAAMIDVIRSHVAEHVAPLPPVTAPTDATDDALLTVYPVGDPHIGLLAWAPEVGDHFDVKIATRELSAAMRSLVARAPASRTAIVAELGDFFHAGDDTATTPRAGHRLDVDGRFARTARLGLDMYVAVLEAALTKHERVIARFVPGNHDLSVAFWISEAIRREFQNEPRVTIHDAHNPYQYDDFGAVMLMWAHCDGAKLAQLAGIAATDEPEMWGRTRFRYAHSGHIHHASQHMAEVPGMVGESHRTLAGRDAWAHWRGYRSGRSLQAITYHRDWGEDSRIVIGIERVRAAIERGAT